MKTETREYISGMRKMQGLKISVFLVCFFCSFAGAEMVQMLDICSNYNINGPDVLLKDIVKDPQVLPSGWGERKVVKSPVPGRAEDVTLSTIALALQKYPDMFDVTLHGQKNLIISRSGMPLSKQKVDEALNAYIQKSGAWSNGIFKAECETLPKDISVPAEEISLKIRNFSKLDQQFRYSFSIDALSGESLVRTFDVKAVVVPMVPVWAAGRDLERGRVVEAADLTAQLVREDEAAKYVKADQVVDNMELIHPLNVGQLVTRQMVMPPVCAQRGETVNVNGNSGSLSVVLKAKALSNGRKGDRILCVNESSKRRLQVMLTGSKEGTIDF